MKVETFYLEINTKGFCDIHDLTVKAEEQLSQSGVENGMAVFFVTGSTAGLTTVEYEPGLIEDLKDFYERIIPRNADYHHEQTWHDGNGFSHIRASLLKPSLTVPVVNGALSLGTWQQVILIDFDNRPRHRRVILQVTGI